MASKFTAPGVEASSTLNSEQWNEFFNEMRKTVWKIDIELKPHRHNARGEHEFHTGVCINSNGLILTSFHDPGKLLRINVQAEDRGQYSATLVHHEKTSGLALVLAKDVNNCNFTDFALKRKLRAGQHFYGIVYPRQASSSIFLMGHLAYQYNPDAELTSTENRKVSDLPAAVYPKDLSANIYLLQIAGLGASDEVQDRPDYEYGNKFGLPEGRGSPVFDATGCLAGLVSFQQAGHDFAIPMDRLQSFCSNYSRPHEQSKQHGQKKWKGVGQSSS